MVTATIPTRPYRFSDRPDAGKALAAALYSYSQRRDTIIFALPRGGVPVAYEVAVALGLPMDIWLVRKLGLPGYEEVALGAIAPGGITVFNDDVMRNFKPAPEALDGVMAREKRELARRNDVFRKGRAPRDVTGKTVIVIDDGLATGATMKAAVLSLRKAGAETVIAAAPVGSRAACAEVAAVADDVVCPVQPEPFYGVGQWYEDFTQTSDREVMEKTGQEA